jgi:hypothetical protein
MGLRLADSTSMFFMAFTPVFLRFTDVFHRFTGDGAGRLFRALPFLFQLCADERLFSATSGVEDAVDA